MANENNTPVRNSFLAIGSLALIAMIIIPFPALLMDILIALLLISSLLIFLVSLCNRKPQIFSLLPTMFLVLAVFNLTIHISITRLILTKGADFDGLLVSTFAALVTVPGDLGGIIVSLIFFVLFSSIMLIIVVKTNTRISEIAASFTLDSLPGKQMALDAEYSSGCIEQREYAIQKVTLQKESDLYGALDGAGKFISGSFKFSVCLSLINAIGGTIIGISLFEKDLSSAVEIYIPLSIAAGFLVQISIALQYAAIGIIVSRSRHKEGDNKFIF